MFSQSANIVNTSVRPTSELEQENDHLVRELKAAKMEYALY